MANRPKGYGMSGEVQNKIAAKYDTDQEQEAVRWIEAVTGENISEGRGALGADALQKKIGDGIILCKGQSGEIALNSEGYKPIDQFPGSVGERLINIIQPGSVKKINEGKMAFKLMENIGNFLGACEKYGMEKADLFQTVDLYEGQNMHQVVNALFALGRKARKNGYKGPTLGPKESEANARHFTDEQLKAGEGVIGLQMGTNQVASQKGMTFGKQRMIID